MAYRCRVTCSERSLPGDLLLGLRRPNVPLAPGWKSAGSAGRWRTAARRRGRSRRHSSSSRHGCLLAAAHVVFTCPRPRMTPWLERLDQRSGDVAGDRGQGLAAGGVRGVDQPLQGLARSAPASALRGRSRRRRPGPAAGELAAELVGQAGELVVIQAYRSQATTAPSQSGNTNAANVFMLRSPEEVIGQHAACRRPAGTACGSSAPGRPGSGSHRRRPRAPG